MTNIRMHSEEPQTVYLTQNQVKELFSTTLTTLWRWRKSGILKAYQVGGRVYYKKHEVEQSFTALK